MKYTVNTPSEAKGNRKYFHEINQSEVDQLIADKKTVDYIQKNYKQPDWCNYPNALSMDMGCWSLCDIRKDGLRTKISQEFCNTCDCFKSKPDK
jgi:hypothetical protein